MSKNQVIDYTNEVGKLTPIIKEQVELMKSFADSSKKAYASLPSDFQKQQREQLRLEQENEKLRQQSIKTQQQLEDLAKRQIQTAQANQRLQAQNRREAEAQERAKQREAKAIEQANKAQERQNKLATEASRPYVQLQARWREAQRILADLVVSQGANAEATKKARIEFEKLDKQIKTVDGITKNYSKNVGNYSSAIGGNLGKLMGAFGVVGGLSTGLAVLKDSINIMREFDSQMTNVSKTTGLAGDELEKLKNKVVDLSKEMGVVSASTLGEYMAVAGQLGVKGSDNLLKFTESMAKLETASNIAGEEGASNIARMLTLVDGGVQNVKKFGDEIVNLGNNFAATEKEILNSATAIAQNTAVYKLGRQNTLAYATALTAVGVEAELSGSKVGKALKSIEEAILNGGKELENYAKIAGLTSKELIDLFNLDKGQALQKFIGGLNSIRESGGSVVDTLNKIGLKEERLQRVLSALASEGGFKVLSDSMNVVKDSANAMENEFRTASEKLIKDMDRPRIAWENLVLSLDNGNKGAVSDVVRGFSRLTAGILEAITPTNNLSDALHGEQLQVNELVTSITNLEEGNQERNKLINELRKNYPDFLTKIGSEDLSNKNLLKTIKEVNNEYLTRIRLQGQAEDVESTKRALEEITKSVGKVQADLYKRLNKAMAEYGLETEIDLNNLVNSAKKIDKELAELGKSRLPFTDRSAIRNDIQNYLQLEESQKRLNNTYSQEKQFLEDLTKATGIQTEAQRNQAKEARKYYETLDEFGNAKKVKEDDKTKINLVEELSKSELKQIEKNNEERLKAKAELKRRELQLEIEGEKESSLMLSQSKGQQLLIEMQYQSRLFEVAELNRQENLRQAGDAQHKQLLAWQTYYEEVDKLMRSYNKAELDYKKEVDKQLSDSAKKAMEEAKKDLEARQKMREEEAKRVKKLADDTKNYLSKFSDMGNFGFSSLNIFTTIEENGKTAFENLLKGAKDWKGQMAVVIGSVGEIAKDVMNSINQASQARFDAEMGRLQVEYETSLAFAGDSVEAKTRLEEEYNQKQKELKKKQAKQEKAFAIMGAIINTAQAVVTALTAGPVIGIVLAGIVGALGAVQIATIASTPIPEFYKGTMNAPEGLALTQERGAEVITDKKGNVKTWGHNKGATLTYLNKGDKVYKSQEDYFKEQDEGFNNELNSILASNRISPIVVNNGVTKDEMMEVMKSTLGNQSQNSIYFDERGFTKSVSRGNSRKIIYNNEVKF